MTVCVRHAGYDRKLFKFQKGCDKVAVVTGVKVVQKYYYTLFFIELIIFY